jgi:hypothetical protein
MQVEKPEDLVEKEKEQVDEEDEQEEGLADGPRVLLLSPNDSDNEPMRANDEHICSIACGEGRERKGRCWIQAQG